MSGAAVGSGGPGPVAQGLKEALVETLNGILCPVQGVRAAAEEQVKVLEVTEGECASERGIWCRRRRRCLDGRSGDGGGELWSLESLWVGARGGRKEAAASVELIRGEGEGGGTAGMGSL